MSRFTSLALAGALITGSSAFKWIGIQDQYTVGVPVTISWDWEGVDAAPLRITLQHEEVGGFATDQYETLIEWVNADYSANSLQWTPNMAGPSFQLEMIANTEEFYGDMGTFKFPILAADGSYVSTVPAGIQRWSNLLPQSVHSGVWPLSMAAAVGHTTDASAASTSSVAPSVTVSISSIPLSTPASVSSTDAVTAPSDTSIAVVPTSTDITITSAPVTTFVSSSTAAVIYPAGNATIAANGTSGGFSVPTATPVYATGAASTIQAGLGAASLLLGSLWFIL